MILCLDVGNTTIHGGVFDGDLLKTQFRRTSEFRASSDELATDPPMSSGCHFRSRRPLACDQSHALALRSGEASRSLLRSVIARPKCLTTRWRFRVST